MYIIIFYNKEENDYKIEHEGDLADKQYLEDFSFTPQKTSFTLSKDPKKAHVFPEEELKYMNGITLCLRMIVGDEYIVGGDVVKG